jgi:hypothetical protein
MTSYNLLLSLPESCQLLPALKPNTSVQEQIVSDKEEYTKEGTPKSVLTFKKTAVHLIFCFFRLKLPKFKSSPNYLQGSSLGKYREVALFV